MPYPLADCLETFSLNDTDINSSSYSLTHRSSENLLATESFDSWPILALNESSPSSLMSADFNAYTSPTFTRRPFFPSTMTSLMPSTSVPTKGSPTAIASNNDIGRPSLVEVRQQTSIIWRRLGMSC